MTGQEAPSNGKKPICYRCTPDISWLRDADRTFLVDAGRGLSWSLRGAEAAMWDWLTLAYPYDKIVHFLALLLRTPADEAERRLVTTLRDWQDKGIVQLMGDSGRGESGDQHSL